MPLDRLNYAWRLACTGAAFAGFSLGGALLATVAYPSLVATSRDRAERQARFRDLISASFRLFVALLEFVGILRLRIEGAERLSECRGRVVVANHPTLIDVVHIVARVPRAQCVVKPALWDHPFLGLVVRAAGYIRSDGDAETVLAACIGALAAGENLVIFPEGTRTPDGETARYRRGFASVAIRARADLQPLVIDCRPRMLERGSRWYDVPERRVDYTMRVEPAIPIAEYAAAPSRAIGARRLAAEVARILGGAKAE